jgi:hypothetical protein
VGERLFFGFVILDLRFFVLNCDLSDSMTGYDFCKNLAVAGLLTGNPRRSRESGGSDPPLPVGRPATARDFGFTIFV